MEEKTNIRRAEGIYRDEDKMTEVNLHAGYNSDINTSIMVLQVETSHLGVL